MPSARVGMARFVAQASSLVIFQRLGQELHIPNRPIHPPRRPTQRGFTLVQLIVVIAIIAILLALLAPALSHAVSAAEAARCGAHLHGIGTAIMAFSNDHDGHLPGEAADRSDGVAVRWFGGWKDDASGNRVFVADAGILSPYWGSPNIADCPSLSLDNSRPEYGPVDYAYNEIFSDSGWHWPPTQQEQDKMRAFASLIRGGATWPQAIQQLLGVLTPADLVPAQSAKWSQINAPHDKAMVFDSARISTLSGHVGEVERTPWGYPPTRQLPSFHGRHGGMGNIVWADGHVSPFTPVRFDSYPEYANVPTAKPQMITNNIGDIDRDGNQQTDELMNLE